MNTVSKTTNLSAFAWRLAPATLALAILSACGGGGGSDSTNTSTNTNTSGPASQYLGTYVWACQDEGSTVVDTATKAPLHSRLTSTFTATSSSTKAMAVLKYEFFANSDCTGLPKSTLTVSGAGSYVEIVGSTQIAGKTAHKAIFYSDAYFPGISAKSISINGITYSGGPYTAGAMATKDLIMLVGNDMFGGDFSKPLDADGFPTALLSSKDATKQ